MSTDTSTTETPPQEGSNTPAADKAEAILEHLINTKGGKRREGQVEMARHVASALSTNRPELIQGGTGIGKALDVDTPIPTAEGWIRMGDLEAGVHHPFDPVTGEPCNITEAFPIRKRRKCYELGFHGGAKLVADAEHLFDTVADSAMTRQRGDDPWEGAQTRTTEEIRDSLRRRNRPNHRIPVTKPVQMPGADLPIDPYELGFWLGGTERRSPTVALVKQNVVPEEMTAFTVELRGVEVAVVPTPEIEEELERLDLLGPDRTIPEQYMFASEEQRSALLSGLMDAMGQPRKAQRQQIAQVAAYKTQVELMEDTHALACSLGHRASLSVREFRNGSYQQVFFTPEKQVFRSKDKAEQAGDFEDQGRRKVGFRAIVSVEEVKTRPVRCIAVDSESRLFLAGRDFIPTHNSLAYLAGALASGQRTAVAPHTKALQDQLGSDLDLVADAFAGADFEDKSVPLDHMPTYAIIKGRSSYYCGSKASGGAEGIAAEVLDLGDVEDYSPSSPLGKEVALLNEWAKKTETGDRSDAPAVSSKAWQMVAASTEDCSANGCKNTPELCFAQLAHEKAKQADIVVVNQAYLAAAMKIEFLGVADCSAVVVDEAHELGMVVAEAFGAALKRKRVEQTLKRATNVLLSDELIDEETAEKWTKDYNYQYDVLERHLRKMSKFGADREIIETPGVKSVLKALINLFDPMRRKVRAATERAADEKGKATRQTLLQTLENLIEDLQVLAAGSDDFQVSWADKEFGEYVLHSARFDVSETIHDELIERMTDGRLVMTSATLMVGGKFDYPAQQMGFTLDEEKYPWSGHVVTSPFDYQEQGMIWLPENMPAPINSPEGKVEYAEAVADVAVGVARAAGGRTLVLCTSKQSVETVSERLKAELEPEGIPVLVQQSGEPPRVIAKEFGENPKAVLVGTRTFWTGVSVEGDTCVAVVVDKVPFPTPSDPIIAARTEKVDRNEGARKGFIKVSLSEAILTIVQGVGRLIRTVNDRGVVVLCDPRVNPRTPHKKSYWRNIADSLPPFTRTVNEERVHEFLREINRTANDAEVSVEVEEAAEDVDEAVEEVAAV